MNIVTLELLAGPAPTTGDIRDTAKYFLRMARIEELHKRRMTARYVHSARTHGLSNREIGEILGHTEGWVRQYLKDTAGKTELWEFADSGFRGHVGTLTGFFKDLRDTSSLDQQLNLCAEHGLTDGAVAEVLSIPAGRVLDLMEGPRAEAAA